MSELKDCPFCGAPAKLERRGGLWSVKVHHTNDCVMRPFEVIPTFGKEAIIRKWNTRKVEKRRGIDDPLDD